MILNLTSGFYESWFIGPANLSAYGTIFIGKRVSEPSCEAKSSIGFSANSLVEIESVTINVVRRCFLLLLVSAQPILRVQLLLPPCCLLEPSSAFLLHQVLAFVTIVVAWSGSPKTTTKTARRRRSRNIHICFVFAKWTVDWHEHGWSREWDNLCWETWSGRVLIYRRGEGKGKGYKEKKETGNMYIYTHIYGKKELINI